MGDALNLAAENGLSLRNNAFTIVCALAQQNHNLLWENAALFDKMGGSEVKILLTYFLYIFRDLYLLVSGEQQLILNIDLSEELACLAEDWNEDGILGAMSDIREAERALDANANVRLTSEALLINLMNWAQRRKSFADSSRGAL
jgi:DNA polymerase-3 subunit delta'